MNRFSHATPIKYTPEESALLEPKEVSLKPAQIIDLQPSPFYKPKSAELSR